MTSLFSDDRAQLAATGITPQEAERQLALLREPPAPTRLVRPAIPGDGIEVLAESSFSQLHALHAEAAREGRFTKFIPASGAASRSRSRPCVEPERSDRVAPDGAPRSARRRLP